MTIKSTTTVEKLKKVSTATVATCLFKRGLKNQFIQHVSPLKLGKPTMVGEAYTLRYIPAREDLNPIEVFRDPKHLQRVAVEECPEECLNMTLYEDFVLEKVQKGSAVIGLYPMVNEAIIKEFEAWKSSRN